MAGEFDPAFEEAKQAVQNGGWSKYAFYVLNTLKEGKENQKEMFRRITALETSFASLQTRVLMYGAIAGLVASGVVSLIIALVVKSGG